MRSKVYALALLALLGQLPALAGPPRLGNRLRYLLAQRQAGRADLAVLTSREVLVSIIHQRPAGRQALRAIQSLEGRLSPRALPPSRVVQASVPWGRVEALAGLAGVVRVEANWRPLVVRPLDVAIPEIKADLLPLLKDGANQPITGQGVVVADFDSNVDHLHPAFFHADGGSYAWLDVDGDGELTPGVDAVDLNANTTADPDETLRFIDATFSSVYGEVEWDNRIYDLDHDWLYADQDLSGRREFGPPRFSDGDPAFGEPIFVADDANGNGRLDLDETVTMLKTSKIIAAVDGQGREFHRGLNLIDSPGDIGGHGTGVSSIILGDRGDRRLHGVVPGADLVAIDAGEFFTFHNAEALAFAESLGAQVMIFEFSGYIWDFLDGSSELETLMDEAHARGVVQVVPTGNLAGVSKVAAFDVPAHGSTAVGFRTPSESYGSPLHAAWVSFYWREPAVDLEITIRSPNGEEVVLPHDWTYNPIQGHNLWAGLDVSDRGTVRHDASLDVNGEAFRNLTFTFIISNPSDHTVSMRANAADDVPGGWAPGVGWTDFVTDRGTMCWPSTADSAIGVGSYVTRGVDGSPPGTLSFFSGQGPRIDGERGVDIVAPGHYDIWAPASQDMPGICPGCYGWFGGTSGAGPFVAGAAAALIQLDPSLSPQELQDALCQAATQDNATGHDLPDERWGCGKLRLYPIGEANLSPVADAGRDWSVWVNATVNLSAAASHDPDGDPLTYLWSVLEGPAPLEIDDPTSPTVKVVPRVGGDYVLQVAVSDPTNLPSLDTALITVRNSAPTASIALEGSAYIGQEVLVDGSASSDPEGSPLFFRWWWDEGSVAQPDLDGLGGEVSFIPHVPGSYILWLAVHDGTVESEAVSATVEVTIPPDAGPDSMPDRAADLAEDLTGPDQAIDGELGDGAADLAEALDLAEEGDVSSFVDAPAPQGDMAAEDGVLALDVSTTADSPLGQDRPTNDGSTKPLGPDSAVDAPQDGGGCGC